MLTHIARWDLDKTYLRTEFDTVRDLLRTAFERPDEKRTNPGAATLLREMVRAKIQVHILSGSPEQMRRRLEDKLRLDGIAWDTFTLKQNLSNVLRLRFRAVRDQLGYKLPALVHARLQSEARKDDSDHDVAAAVRRGKVVVRETLFGDDAEADAFVYSLYADLVAGRVTVDTLIRICERGRIYPDTLHELVEDTRALQSADVVERILIHLERQTPPDDLKVYGTRAVPFYNYFQAALVVFEDRRISAEAVLRVGVELVAQHRFDGDGLARSYLDLARRGHLRGLHVEELQRALETWSARERIPWSSELNRMLERIPEYAELARSVYREEAPSVDYAAMVGRHNPRRR